MIIQKHNRKQNLQIEEVIRTKFKICKLLLLWSLLKQVLVFLQMFSQLTIQCLSLQVVQNLRILHFNGIHLLEKIRLNSVGVGNSIKHSEMERNTTLLQLKLNGKKETNINQLMELVQVEHNSHSKFIVGIQLRVLIPTIQSTIQEFQFINAMKKENLLVM